jgi:tRNA pseudouridine55 synthase
MATGLLPVCLGDATKFSQGLLDADKGYLATALLGVATDTGDREGQVVAQRPVEASEAQVQAALASLTGDLEQVPPMYSALKHQGQPLYAIARAGGEVARAARTIRIHRLQLLEWDSPRLTFEVSCSKGTYVRTLAEQIAERLGTVAHLVALRRTAVGPFSLDAAVTLADLEAGTQAQRAAHLHPADTLVQGLPKLMLGAEAALGVLQGRTLDPCPWRAASAVEGLARIYGPRDLPGVRAPTGSGAQEGTFLGLGMLEPGERGERRLRPVRLIAHAQPPSAAKNAGFSPLRDETT